MIATVAPGRSLVWYGQWYGPGDFVVLPAQTAAWLQAMGFLTDSFLPIDMPGLEDF